MQDLAAGSEFLIFNSGNLNLPLSARLDGTGEKVRSRLAQHATIEDWLELGLEEKARPVRLGQKRVRPALV